MTEREYLTGADPYAMLRQLGVCDDGIVGSSLSGEALDCFLRVAKVLLGWSKNAPASAARWGTPAPASLSLTLATHAGSHKRRLAEFLRDIVGNPFRSTQQQIAREALAQCLTESVLGLAHTIHDSGNFADLPLLADALEEAGCSNDSVLRHCRGDKMFGGPCTACDGHGEVVQEWPRFIIPCARCERTGQKPVPVVHVRGCWIVRGILEAAEEIVAVG